MKSHFIKLLHGLRQMSHKHVEYIGIAVALLILYIFPVMIRSIDPSAAPIDAGILSAIILAVVAVLIFLSITWWIIRSIWSFFRAYSETSLTTVFNTLTPWQKIRIYLGFYLSLFFSFVIALIAIL